MERYIEAEALKKVMCEGCDNVHLCAESPACETVQQIDAQPTADVVSMERYINAIKTINMMSKVLAEFAPVKHGHWIVDKSGYPSIICSECSVKIPMVAGWCMDAHINYCPNCGAKMDEVTE